MRSLGGRTVPDGSVGILPAYIMVDFIDIIEIIDTAGRKNKAFAYRNYRHNSKVLPRKCSLVQLLAQFTSNS